MNLERVRTCENAWERSKIKWRLERKSERPNRIWLRPFDCHGPKGWLFVTQFWIKTGFIFQRFFCPIWAYRVWFALRHDLGQSIWEGRERQKKEKSPSSGGIWTHDNWITRRLLYRCVIIMPTVRLSKADQWQLRPVQCIQYNLTDSSFAVNETNSGVQNHNHFSLKIERK